MTGDPVIDAAIARFVSNPSTLPCDERSTWKDYWAMGGTDGRPQRRLSELPSFHVKRPSRDIAEHTLTRQEVLEARDGQ